MEHSLPAAASPQAMFGQLLAQVAGSVFEAAGYALESTAAHHSRGLFRYRKALKADLYTFVEFQMLAYQGMPSRFRVNLLRNTTSDARAAAPNEEKLEITLARLLWDVFKADRYGSPDYWWQFNGAAQLGQALADAGKMVFAFGIPYIEGTLSADDI
jgi:hypothetical protein